MPIPPQIYLETQIRRLLPEVGNVTRAQLSREKWPGGIGHWAAAVLRAKEALASGDEQRMREAVPFCQALERDGGKVITATKAKSLRRLGGKKRGQKQAADAAPFWKPYQDLCEKLEGEGRSHNASVRLVEKQITRDGFCPPACKGALPSSRSIRKWLKK